MERSQTSKGQIARQRILREAETLLEARGFHGTSMRDVAESAGIALANVVYHFPRKEQLHAAVLDGIAAVLSERMRRSPSDPIRELVRWSVSHPRHVRLLVRELLDNPARVSKASRLPLAPVLLLLADAVRAKTPEHPDPELAVLHLIGALSYVVIARPTVRRILGTKRDDEMAMQCTHLDGSPIPDADVEAVREAIWRNLVIVPWRRGDVLAIDNFAVSHGRLPYAGPR